MKITLLLMCLLVLPVTLIADDLEGFGANMSDFYLDPSVKKFELFQKQGAKVEKELLGEKNSAGLLVAVMFARISEKHSWPIKGGNKLALLAKDVLKGQSKLAKYVNNDKQVDPKKLDIWWCSYFATGDTKYLDKILVYAGEDNSKSRSSMILVIGAATWSYKSNCRQHESIKKHTETCLRKAEYKHKVDYLKECVKPKPTKR